MHHIVSDAWSMGVLIGEVVASTKATQPAARSRFLHCRSSTLTLPRGSESGYRATCSMNSSHIGGNNSAGACRFWKCLDRPRPALQTYNGSSLSFPLSPDLSQSLKSLCKAEGVTLFIMLSRLSKSFSIAIQASKT